MAAIPQYESAFGQDYDPYRDDPGMRALIEEEFRKSAATAPKRGFLSSVLGFGIVLGGIWVYNRWQDWGAPTKRRRRKRRRRRHRR